MRTQLRLGASLLAILVCAAGSAGADVYRWTDEDGQLHFTSDLSQVPARYRDQAATPAESKATFNEVEVPAATAAPAPTQAPAKASTHGPVPRIPSDSREPSRSRMAEFEAQEKAEEEAAKPAPEGPQKYFRDCSGAGRCRSTLNGDWVRWNEERKAKEAAANADE